MQMQRLTNELSRLAAAGSLAATRVGSHACARVALGGMALAAFALPVLAQQARKGDAPAPLKPPTPGAPDTPPMIWNVLLTVLVVGMIVGVALIPSKRGHQD